MSRSPTLGEVLNSAVERGAIDLRVALPAKIEAFDPVTQLARVKPLLQEIYRDEEGNDQIEVLASIVDVPVLFPGGGGYAQTWPVAEGDPCLLVFTDRSIDQWIAKGGDVDPVDARRHDISDAVAILGVRSKPGALTEFDASRAVWGNKGPRIAADGSAVHVGVDHGVSGSQDAIRGTEYRGKENSLLDSIGSAATEANTALISASANLIAAASSNAIPMVGGGIAAPTFSSAAAQLIQAGVALAKIKAAVITFKATESTYLTSKVKLP